MWDRRLLNFRSVLKHLEWLELKLATPNNIQDMRTTRIELNCWHDKEDSMWYQRSRMNWFQSSDMITGFFHAKASARFKKNQMCELMDAHDFWQEDEERMGNMVIDY